MNGRANTMADLWAKVDLAHPDGCWPFLGRIDTRGYGKVSWQGKQRLAHRVYYELWYGPIPNGLVLDHLCRNKACVRPLHLEPVPQRVNVQRGEAGQYLRRRTHCPSGHAYTEANTIHPRGTDWRACRECRRRTGREYMRRKRSSGR